MNGFNRRGNVFDMFWIVGLIAFALIVMVVFIKIIDDVNTEMQSDDAVTSEGKKFISNIQSQNAWMLDFLFLMFLFSLPLASAVLAYFNNIPPFFFWATIGVWMLIVILANIIGDAWSNVVTDGNLASTVSSIPMTSFIMNNFVAYVFVCLLIVGFGVFVKLRNPMGGYY